MAPSTPPPPARLEFAAFTMASTATRVISPSCRMSFFPVPLVHSIHFHYTTGPPPLPIHYNRFMTRRELLAGGAACATTLWARSHMDKSRISAITDEIGLSTDEAIRFAHQYGMHFVEIRNPAGSKKEYFQMSEAEIKVDALRFANEGLKVSFVNTSLLKFGWPGSEPVRRRPEEPDAREKRLAAEKVRWDRRTEDLHKAIRCAQIMGCDKIRVFTGSRVEDPKTMYSRIAETIGSEMA